MMMRQWDELRDAAELTAEGMEKGDRGIAQATTSDQAPPHLKALDHQHR